MGDSSDFISSFQQINAKDIIGWLVPSIAVIIAFFLGLRTESKRRKTLLQDTTKGIWLLEDPLNTQGIQLRITNNSNYTLRNARVLITMDYGAEDLLYPRGFEAWIETELLYLIDAEVCWSRQKNGRNVSERDIFPIEVATVSVFRFDYSGSHRIIEHADWSKERPSNEPPPVKDNIPMLVVASGEGFSNDESGKQARKSGNPIKANAVLELKDYTFLLKFLSEDSHPKVWMVEIKNKRIRRIEEISVVRSLDMQFGIREKWRGETWAKDKRMIA